LTDGLAVGEVLGVLRRLHTGCLRLAWMLLLAGCTGERASAPPPANAPTSDDPHVSFEALTPGVWLHRSVKYLPEYGEVPSNGLVVKTASGALIVDTAWTPAQTAEVLDWAAAHVGPVRAALVTHWHDDRSGGLPEVHRRGIASYGSGRTAEQARAHGAPIASQRFDDTLDLSSLGVAGEAYFPGAGHSLDNVVVWLADSKLLFGGCLVKSTQAQGLGNTADGDVQAWPRAIAELEARYPSAAIVVPGHGAAGGPDLLAHTRELLAR
jgi:metallo-beta-lactamase class B